MKILITGGAGFIGGALVKRLIPNHEVYIIDNLSSGKLKNTSGCKKLYQVDITDFESLAEAVREVEPAVVIHLAAMVSVQESLNHPTLCKKINVEGTRNVTRALGERKVKIIFASSSAVYGEQVPPLEESMTSFSATYLKSLLSPYAESKIMSEAILNQSGVTALNLRFFNIYGPGQNVESGYAAVIPAFIRGITHQGRISVFGSGEQTRDFIYIDDVCEAIERAMALEKNETLNIASGRPVSLLQLIENLKELLPGFKVEFHEARNGDIEFSYADTRHTKEVLGFSASTELVAGLRIMAGI